MSVSSDLLYKESEVCEEYFCNSSHSTSYNSASSDDTVTCEESTVSESQSGVLINDAGFRFIMRLQFKNDENINDYGELFSSDNDALENCLIAACTKNGLSNLNVKKRGEWMSMPMERRISVVIMINNLRSIGDFNKLTSGETAEKIYLATEHEIKNNNDITRINNGEPLDVSIKIISGTPLCDAMSRLPDDEEFRCMSENLEKKSSKKNFIKKCFNDKIISNKSNNEELEEEFFIEDDLEKAEGCCTLGNCILI